MAEGFMAIDPDKTWKAMQKEGRQLFRRLGRLRDVQVLEEWAARLGERADPVAGAILLHLGQSEQEQKRAAVEALQAFNADKWRGWIGPLQARARRLPVGGAVFQLSALQAWNEAHGLHKQALRNRSAAAFHRLRIGIKRFRYTVENFLPLLHDLWGRDLKEMQDCLGEAHDLVMFWQTALRIRAFPDPESRERWRALIAAEKTKRLDHYRAKMAGSHSLWNDWREGLPPQERLAPVSLRMIEKWACFHGIDLVRARRVRRLAMQLFNGLWPGRQADIKDRRAVLHFAAILHEMGRGKRGKAGGRSAAGLLPRLPSAPGFTAESLSRAAMVIQGHRGRFRGFEGAHYDALSEAERRDVMELCGILRLARALSRDRKQVIGSLRVEQAGDSIIIYAAGFSEFGSLAEKAARARYLLECACGRPVILRSDPAVQSAGEPDDSPTGPAEPAPAV